MTKRIFSIFLICVLMTVSVTPIAQGLAWNCAICGAGETVLCSAGEHMQCAVCEHCVDCSENGNCVCPQCNTNDVAMGTQVVYQAQGTEEYTLTVPAKMHPGTAGTVTLAGTWPQNKTINVTADPTVTLTNTILATDKKVLQIAFAGISANGNNTTSQTLTETISVSDISQAIFGTWKGQFNYNVEIASPYMIRFYQPYLLTLSETAWVEFIFHEDGAVDIYYYDDGYRYGETYEPGAATYETGNISIFDTSYGISESGEEIYTDDYTATLIPTRKAPILFDTSYECKNESYTSSAIFYENGTADYEEYVDGELSYTETFDSQFVYYDEYMDEVWYDIYEDETYTTRHSIHPDGTKLIMYGDIYTLGCRHPETEVRNEDDEYSGDIYCTICDKQIQTGKNKNGDAYALLLNNEDDADNPLPMVFVRTKNEILTGDTFNSKTFGEKEVLEVYTGFERKSYSGEYIDDGWLASSNVPWRSIASDVSSVTFEDEIKPISSAFWFAWFECEDYDLTLLNTDNITDMSSMFYYSQVSDTSSLKIPANLQTIDSMFESCQNLQIVPIFKNASQLTSLRRAFYKSNIVTGPELPSNIEDLTQTFALCKNLVTMPTISSTRPIRLDGTFAESSSLAGEVYIDAEIDWENSKRFKNAFEGCGANGHLTVKAWDFAIVSLCATGHDANIIVELKETTIIPDYFRGERGVYHSTTSDPVTLIIPEGVEEIGSNAFESCQGLTTVYLPSTIKSIKLQGFYFFNKDFYYNGTISEWQQVNTGFLWCGTYSSSLINQVLATAPCATLHCSDGDVIIRAADVK